MAAVEIIESPQPSALRSPSDVFRLVVAFVVIVVIELVQWLAGDEIVSFADKVLAGVDAISPNVIGLVVVSTWVLSILLVVGAIVAVFASKQWRGALTVLVAGAAGGAFAALLSAPDEPTASTPTEVAEWFDGLVRAPTVTEVGLAAIAAAVTAAAPWVPRLWRRLGWTLVIALFITRSLATPIALSSVRAVLAGWLVGAIVVVALGGPSRRPRGAAIADGLALVGLPLQRLEQASLDARGSTPYFGVGTDGRKLFVKVLGRDERSADLLFRAYRKVLPRNLGDESGYLSLRRAVEHEALLALAARDLGTQTPRFVALATAEPGGFILTYETIAGRSLDRVEAEEITDDVLRAIWTQIMLLRSHRLAHRDLRLANIFLDDDAQVWIIDFGFSELAASDTLLSTDLAELIASSALKVGNVRAVAIAAEFLDAAGFQSAQSRLKPWALAGATRTAYKAEASEFTDLGRRVAAHAG